MTLRILRSALVLFLALALAPPAAAQTSHYVAPPGWQGAGTGDGTQANPWRSIGDALKAAGPGDTLLLMDGSYGALVWGGAINSTPEAPITIRSLNGKSAHFESILFRWADNAVLRNLSVWPTAATVTRPANYVFTNGANVTIDGLDVRSEASAPATMYDWTIEEWNARAKNGINMAGDAAKILKSTVTGCFFALISGTNSRMIGNEVIGFAGDAIRIFGNGGIVRGNRVRDAFAIGGNHNDGIQSFTTEGNPFINVTIEDNIIIGWTHPNKTHPLRSVLLQGIGLFDGPYKGWTIRNNIVAVTHLHGITINDAVDTVITHNTVVDLEPGLHGAPMINAFNEAPLALSNVLIANNLAMGLGTNDALGEVTFIGNSVISSPGAVFEDPAAYDYRPRAESGFIDTADPAHAAARDVFGNARPQGNGPDRGAVELGGAGGGGEPPAEEAPPPEEPVAEEPAPEEPAQPEQPPAEDGGTGDTGSGTPDGGSTGDGSGDTGDTGGTEPAPTPGPKFEKPPKKDTPNKGKGADKQALKTEKAARREARRAARASARAARLTAPVVSTKAPVLSGVSPQSVGFWR